MDHRSSVQEDAKAVSLVLAGDKQAFEGLLQRHRSSVLALCKRMLSKESDAQDVFQETALQAFLGMRTLREPDRFGAWLHSIAANLARAKLRWDRRRPALSLDSPGSTSPDRGGYTGRSREQVTNQWLADDAPSPEEVRFTRELHDEILGAIQRLSVPNREAVIGYYLQGYSQVELAELLGVPVSSIKGRLHKSRKQLRLSLEPVAFQVFEPNRKEKKVVDGESLVKVVVEDALKMPSDDWRGLEMERGLEMLKFGGSLRELPNLTSLESLTGLPSIAVVLEEENGGRVLPVWMGVSEGLSIWSSVSGNERPRPMTHDLMRELLLAVDLKVEKVAIVRLADHTFYGEISTRRGNGGETSGRRVDSRPSDAIALAIRLRAPIYVAQSVLDGAAFESKQALLEAQREERGPFRE